MARWNFPAPRRLPGLASEHGIACALLERPLRASTPIAKLLIGKSGRSSSQASSMRVGVGLACGLARRLNLAAASGPIRACD